MSHSQPLITEIRPFDASVTVGALHHSADDEWDARQTYQRADVSQRSATAARATETGLASRYVASKPETLPMFKLYQPQAGHPNWPLLWAEATEFVAQIRPKLTKPVRGWSKWRRQAASYRTLASNYLLNRKLTKQGREDLRPLYFIWTMLRTCNFACTYCDDHQGRRYPELSNEGVLDTADSRRLLEVMRTRTSSVYFAGGEPTIRDDLPQITRAARDLNYYPIIINTNGSLLQRQLSKDDWKDWLANMDIVIVSLDGLDVRKMNSMWVYRNSQDVFRNLLILHQLRDEMGFKLMVNCVIQPGFIDEARAVLDFANDMDIWFAPVPVNVGPTVSGEIRSLPEYDALVETILARKSDGRKIIGSKRMLKRLLRSEPLVCRNTVKPHIDHDGRLAWPCKASVNVKPAYVNVLDFNNVDELYDYASAQVNPTRFHGPACNQCGANCNWAQNYTTDTYAHGLAHPSSLLLDIADFLRS